VRLGGIENVVLEDSEETFDQLQARIKRTVGILESVDPNSMNGKETSEVIVDTKVGKFRVATAQAYVSEYAIPNFHFHLSTVYCIVRHLGVPINLMDYLGKDTLQKM